MNKKSGKLREKANRYLERQVREPQRGLLVEDVEPDWRSLWWGMPNFSMGDAEPLARVTVNFWTQEDYLDFLKLVGAKGTLTTKSIWYPPGKILRGQMYYDGPPTDTRYPVCIPSKGRADCQSTGKRLDRMGVPYQFFVEETEYDDYCAHLGEDSVTKLPFHDLGHGSIPARNFIWEWAKERGHRRHWVVDDNIVTFIRCNNNYRFPVYGGGFFRAIEDFVDRYANVGLAGPHGKGFVMDRTAKQRPILMNHRVYSCILVDTDLTHRWRGRYNEDTDLSLRVLKDGYCTVLFRALCMNKASTAFSKGGGMKGGNTDTVYNTGDHRKEFAESLRRQHPDVVEVVWRYNRWHHLVDYAKFSKNKLVLRPGVTPIAKDDEYGMHLVKRIREDDDEDQSRDTTG